MTISHKTILIVDDDAALRRALAMIFTDAGFDVYLAADGFSALAQMRHTIPDILLSDLNMPGMSGFELLSIVRRRFPAASVIAMSGAFTGDQIPPGVAADAFYAKGRSGVIALIQLAHALSEGGRPLERESPVPVWIARTPFNPLDDANVVITCPECLRVFSQSIGKKHFSVDETHCMHCSSTVRFALVQPELGTDRTGLGRAD
jgi:CheY-like chemotaxis protein